MLSFKLRTFVVFVESFQHASRPLRIKADQQKLSFVEQMCKIIALSTTRECNYLKDL
jgi:hypothetical protein